MNNLKKLLIEIGKIEMKIELVRLQLSLIINKDINSIFQKIFQKDQIFDSDLYIFLTQNKIQVTIEDCEMFMKFFANDEKCLDFYEFQKILTPKQNHKNQKQYNSNKKYDFSSYSNKKFDITLKQPENFRSNKDSNKIHEDIIYLICKIFQMEINGMNQNENLKQILHQNKQLVRPEDLFYEIDSFVQEYINLENLLNYLQNVQQEIVQSVLYKMQNENGVIILADFIKNIIPLKNPLQKEAIFQNEGLKQLNAKQKSVKIKQIINDPQQQKMMEQFCSFLMIAIYQKLKLNLEIDQAKKDLYFQTGFDIKKLFQKMQTNQKVNSGKFQKYMEDLQIYPNKYSLFLMTRSVDRNQDGYLDYQEFKNMFKPYQVEKQNIAFNQNFDKEVMKQLFLTYLQNETAKEALRQKIQQELNFDFKFVFEYLDIDNDGLLSKKDIELNLEKYGMNIDLDDINFLFYCINGQKSDTITYMTFLQCLTPTIPIKLI